ncbi:Glutamate--cysteine ligase EgtA OS=Streptomyces microflavus OX=1919 GN=egtA PE=3 SV=1 [Streptomyces microflavus]
MSSDTPGGPGPRLDTAPLDEGAAQDLLRGICFKTGPPRIVGVELEWLIHDREHPAVPVDGERLDSAVAARELPLSAALTFEPGGQLELSSQPAGSLMECIETTAADLAAVRGSLGRAGLAPVGLGVDPWPQPLRATRLDDGRPRGPGRSGAEGGGRRLLRDGAHRAGPDGRE